MRVRTSCAGGVRGRRRERARDQPGVGSGFPSLGTPEGEVGVVATGLEPGVVDREPLGVADEEEARAAKQTIECGQRTAPRGGIEVDQHVAAEDDVVGRMAAQEVGVEQVAAGESDRRADPGVEREALRIRAGLEVTVAEAEVGSPRNEWAR